MNFLIYITYGRKIIVLYPTILFFGIPRSIGYFQKKIVLLLRFFNSSIHIQNEEDNFTFYGFADDYNGSSRPCFKGKCNARLQEFPNL